MPFMRLISAVKSLDPVSLRSVTCLPCSQIGNRMLVADCLRLHWPLCPQSAQVRPVRSMVFTHESVR